MLHCDSKCVFEKAIKGNDSNILEYYKTSTLAALREEAKSLVEYAKEES